MIIALMLSLPVLAAVVLLLRRPAFTRLALPLGALLHLGGTVWLLRTPHDGTAYFAVDPLGRLFLLILAILFTAAAFYSYHYLRTCGQSAGRQLGFTVSFLFFVAAMTGVLLAQHLALLWVFLEATTLFSAPLIYFEKSRSSLEAAWKYLFINSIGIALAFVGIILLSLGAAGIHSLFLPDLYRFSGQISPFWLKAAFPFMLVGFGTKAGFAPVHSWLPDAHSEAPAPVSAMLSGTLLNGALLAILRVMKLMRLGQADGYARSLLLVMGFLSLLVAAVFLVKVKSFKRLLAYSSVENMGIVAVALAAGAPAAFAAMLHVMAHSLSKGAFFLTAGTIYHRFHSKHTRDVRGLLASSPITGWLWLGSMVAIIALPPFPAFFSEYFLLRALLSGGHVVQSVLLLLLLTVAMYGLARAVFHMCFGEPGEIPAAEAAPLLHHPQLVLLGVLLALGVAMPGFIYEMLQAAALY